MTDGDVKLWETTSYREKQSTRVQSQSIPCSSRLSTSIIHGGSWCSFLPNKRCLSIFLYHCMERLLAKRWGEIKKKTELPVNWRNIWHAEFINKTLFKASRLSSHRLFKRLEKMLVIIYFRLLSAIPLSVYWEGKLKAKVKRAYFFC